MFYKKIEIEKGDFEKISNINHNTNIIIVQSSLIYYYFLIDRFLFVGWFNCLIIILIAYNLFSFSFAKAILDTFNKYPNFSSILILNKQQ
jgi:hypothetical protein